jgi:hypothetical protein
MIAAGGASSTSRYFSETAIADLLWAFSQQYSAAERLADAPAGAPDLPPDVERHYGVYREASRPPV